MSDPKELISVYKAANVTEAHLVKNLLLDVGIEAFVSEENEPLSGLGIAQSDVLVSLGDETAARQVVDEYDEQQIRRADRPDWVCPKCQASVIGAFDECDACGAIRPGSEEPDDEEEDFSE